MNRAAFFTPSTLALSDKLEADENVLALDQR